MSDAHVRIGDDEMYQAEFDRNSAILFLVSQLDIKPDEVAAARSALDMDPCFPLAGGSENADESDGGAE